MTTRPLEFGVFYAPFHPGAGPGFGTFPLVGHDRASPERTINSYRLFARHVIPHFKRRLAAPVASHEWATNKRNELYGRAGQAIMNAIQTHVQEKAEETSEEKAA